MILLLLVQLFLKILAIEKDDAGSSCVICGHSSVTYRLPVPTYPSLMGCRMGIKGDSHVFMELKHTAK